MGKEQATVRPGPPSPAGQIPLAGPEERLAWYALLAIPALVPTTVGRLLFVSGSAFTYDVIVKPKILMFALLISVAAIAWAVGVFRGTIPVRTIPHGWWLAGFVGLAGISTASGLHPATAFFGGNYNAVGMMVLLLASILYVLCVQLVTRSERVRALSWSTVAGGSIVAAVAILQVFGIDALRHKSTYQFLLDRGASLLGNPDFTGTYLVVPTVIAAALALSARNARERVVAWSCFGVALSAVALSLTRGAWVGMAVALGLLGVAAFRSSINRKVLWALVAFAGAGLGVALVAGGIGRYADRFADLAQMSTAGGGRLTLWRDALAVIGMHPLFGTGPDSYRLGWYAIRSAESVGASGLGSITEDPHNVLLLVAATTGIPATIALVGMLCSVLAGSRRAAFVRMASPTRLPYSAWWAALGGLAVASVFAANTVVATLVFAVSAAVLAAPRSQTTEVPPVASRSFSAAIGGVAAVCLVLSAITISGDIRLRRAVESSDIALGAAEAARIAPWHPKAAYMAASESVDEALSALLNQRPGAPLIAEDVEAQVRRLIEDNPFEYENHILLVYLLTNRGILEGPVHFERAITTAQRAFDVHPISAQTAYYKAFAEYRLGMPEVAAKTLEPLWDVDPRYPEAGILYVEVLGALGNSEDGEAVLAVLREWFPGSSEVETAAEALEASD